MNTLTKFATATLTLALLTGSALAAPQYYPAPRPEPAFQGPPPEFAYARDRGYKDGVYGARKDFENHRRPTPMNRDEYRNPHFIAPPDRRDYLVGFRQGYWEGVRNIYGPGYRPY